MDEETLDPEDWATLAELSHRIIDDAIAYLREVDERPAWQEMPDDVRDFFAEPLPVSGMGADGVYDAVIRNVMRYPMGNVHPRFWAWYMGAGNYTGALGDFLAAVQGSNLGGGNHAAAYLELQVIDWCRQMTGMPEDSSGLLVSGGSMANFTALAVARNVHAGVDVRELGVAAIPRPLRFYASNQVHSCHRKALEALGHGNSALRQVSADSELRMDIEELTDAIREDRAAGFQPACIIASAGTVNTGAIDDLEALADLAAAEGLWLHVDGCIGALLAIAPRNRWRVAGIERAHSIALDPHKWLHAPFDVGCVLVRDARAHRETFAVTPEYLEKTPRGIASANWLHEMGLQTSRGFRALKVWMALKEHGVEKFGRLIDQNIDQAAYLGELVAREGCLETVAPATINILCFRYRRDGMDDATMKSVNTEIMLRLQEEGTAVLSDTTVRGVHCLRVAINNHRTRRSDLKLLVEEVVGLGDSLSERYPRYG